MAKRDNPDAYKSHRQYVADKDRAESAAGRDIGELPPVENPERRAKGRTDALHFYRTYFPRRFYLEFGPPQIEATKALSHCSEHGGLHAFCMMRGGGKTTLAECETIRAIVYGLRRYVVYLGATDPLAAKGIKKILREFEVNPLLAADFPEVCYPIRRLERIHQRAKGQTLGGVPTLMELTDGHIVLPTVKDSPSSGAVIQSFGLTGAIKGLNHLLADGEPIRPDLVILDDCQTRESAKSFTQTNDRERIVCDDVLGLAGPTTNIAAFFLCTPIYEGDLTERFLDREKHPEWEGTRTRMVVKFPKNREWWDRYAEVRREGVLAGDKGRAGNELYERERTTADEGCELSWPGRKKPNDVSAVQTAMNLSIDQPEAFLSEYQCQPAADRLADEAKELVPADVAARFTGLKAGEVPAACSRLTAFIDVGSNLLWFTVTAWNESFGGSVVSYGVWPEQTRSVFQAARPPRGLKDVYPDYTDNQRVFAGLSALLPAVLGVDYQREGGGAALRVERCLIDVGDGNTAPAVYEAIKKSAFANVVYPSKGYARSDSQSGVGRWANRTGELAGHHWKLTAGQTGKGRLVVFDSDVWKSHVHGLLTTPEGGPAALRLFGSKASQHELFAAHLAAEFSEVKEVKGERFDKWRVKAGRLDNHWFDTLVGSAVAASVAGVKIAVTVGDVPDVPPPPKKRRNYAEEYAAARQKNLAGG